MAVHHETEVPKDFGFPSSAMWNEGKGAILFVATVGFSALFVGIHSQFALLSLSILVLQLVVGFVMPRVSKDYSYITDLVNFVVSCCLFPHMMVEVDDPAFRHRGFGMYAIIYRSVMLCYCQNSRHCVIAMAIIGVSEVFATWRSFSREGAEMPMRVVFTLMLISISFIWHNRRSKKQWDVFRSLKRELVDEKVAQESLISMLCDSCIHLAPDDNTLIRSTPHFDNLVDQEARGTSFTNYLPSLDNERVRFAEALKRAKQSPVALPVTLLSKGFAKHKVDLFIVRRRNIASASYSNEGQGDFGFLVGVRLDQNTSEPEAWNGPSAEVAPGQAKLSGHAGPISIPDDLASIPESALAAAVEFSRCCQLSMLPEVGAAAISRPTKNTFLHFQTSQKSQMSRRPTSAPPVVGRTEKSLSGDRYETASTRSRELRRVSSHDDMETRSDTTLRTNSSGEQVRWLPLPQQSPSVYTLDKASEAAVSEPQSQAIRSTGGFSSDAMSISSSHLSSELSSEASNSAFLKVGSTLFSDTPTQSFARLSDIVQMKKVGSLSVGSFHDGDGHSSCVPCSFHFAHLRNPARQPCKASYLCEFCHNEDRRGWRRVRSAAKAKHKPPEPLGRAGRAQVKAPVEMTGCLNYSTYADMTEPLIQAI